MFVLILIHHSFKFSYQAVHKITNKYQHMCKNKQIRLRNSNFPGKLSAGVVKSESCLFLFARRARTGLQQSCALNSSASITTHAPVAEQVYACALGAHRESRAGSSSVWCTIEKRRSLTPGKDVRRPFLFLRQGENDGPEVQALPYGHNDRQGKYVCAC